jgi:pimeloyl-ACP methyl ester carboxylesterase
MRVSLAFAVALAAGGCFAQPMQPGRNTCELRGHQQDVYFYSGGPGRRPVVLFAPGDGGWRGFAIDIAKAVAAWGYDVYGIDTKRYLSSFTSGKSTLSEADVISDFHALAERISKDGGVYMVGWSEGAGLGLLATAGDAGKKTFAGFAAIGLPEASVLGWRTIDNLTYITKKDPDEPHFQSAPWLPKIAPLPFAMILSDHDEYTSVESAKSMYAAAREPKHWWLIAARNHRYDGARDEFFRALHEALAWIGKGGR